MKICNFVMKGLKVSKQVQLLDI